MNLLQDSFTLSTQLVSLSEYKIWVDFCAFDPNAKTKGYVPLLWVRQILTRQMLPPGGQRVLCSTIPPVYSGFAFQGKNFKGEYGTR